MFHFFFVYEEYIQGQMDKGRGGGGAVGGSGGLFAGYSLQVEVCC